LIFASPEPVSLKELKKTILDIDVLEAILKSLEIKYASSGFNLYKINNSYAFRTSPEVSEFLNVETIVPRPLSRAASETLAIIAYHQPITRSEIESIRGVSLSKGTLDALLELNWIKPGQRKSTPGNPLTWRTSDIFLDHFGLKEISDLPGIDDLKNSGLLEKDNIIFKDVPSE
jgi:segregation and condensation protein B